MAGIKFWDGSEPREIRVREGGSWVPIREVHVSDPTAPGGLLKVWPTTEVHQVSVSGKSGTNAAHPLVTVTVPAGQTWSVRVQGTMQSTFPPYPGDPKIRIGSSTSSGYGNNAAVDYSGTITASNSTIALVTAGDSWSGSAGFTGTVTIEK